MWSLAHLHSVDTEWKPKPAHEGQVTRYVIQALFVSNRSSMLIHSEDCSLFPNTPLCHFFTDNIFDSDVSGPG